MSKDLWVPQTKLHYKTDPYSSENGTSVFSVRPYLDFFLLRHRMSQQSNCISTRVPVLWFIKPSYCLFLSVPSENSCFVGMTTHTSHGQSPSLKYLQPTCLLSGFTTLTSSTGHPLPSLRLVENSVSSTLSPTYHGKPNT